MKLQLKKMSISICKKDEVLKGDNNTVENKGIVEYGNDFLNCKFIHSKQKKFEEIYFKHRIPM